MTRWILGNRLAASAALAGGLAVVLPHVAPAVVWIPWAWFLGASAVLITRRATGIPMFARLIGISFAIRSALAAVMFAISWFKLPLLPALQLKHGLWAFGGDGGGYQDQALGILDAWHSGIELNSIFAGGGYDYRGPSLLMAGIYGIVGSLPLHFMLLNAWIGAMCGLLAYLLAIRIQDKRSALAAGVLVTFWPSSIFWSSQLMKDSLQVGLAVSALLLLVALWQRLSAGARVSPRSAWGDGWRWGALAVTVFAISYLRSYLGMLLTISVASVMGLALIHALWRRRIVRALAAAAIAATVAAATAAGTSVDLYALFSPSHPEIGHVNRGDLYKQQHKIESAAASYRHAIALNPRYAPAYRALGMMLIEQGDRTAAVAALRTYLQLEPDANRRASIAAVVERAQPPATHRAEAHTNVAPQVSDGRPSPTVTPTSPAVAPTSRNTASGVVSRSMVAMRTPLSWTSVESLDRMRRIQVGVGGASVIDATTRFHSPWDVAAYMPKAAANAYLAPFPWQWLFTGGGTGIMRPVSSVEVIAIALLIPALLIGLAQRVRRFRPDEWMLVAFVLVVSLGLGFMMPNVGTLFRLRLQFLIPALILASTALPAFAYRLVDKLSPPQPTPSAAGRAVSA